LSFIQEQADGLAGGTDKNSNFCLCCEATRSLNTKVKQPCQVDSRSPYFLNPGVRT
jgi:hypothetical protein